MRDRKKGKPSAANNRVKWLRAMLKLGLRRAIEMGQDEFGAPGQGGRLRKEDVPHMDSRKEFLQFETRHPLGSKPRLAMSILAYTGMRRCDAVRLKPQHVKDGWDHVHPAEDKEEFYVCLCSTCSRMCSTRVRLARRPIWRRSMASHSRPMGLAGGSAIAVTRPIFTSALPMGSAAPARPSLPRTGRRCPTDGDFRLGDR